MKKGDIFSTYDDLGMEGSVFGDKKIVNGILQDKENIKKEGDSGEGQERD